MITLEDIAQNLKKNNKYWIAFVGDSITSCEWVHPNWRDIIQYVLQEEMTDYLNRNWKLSEWGIKGFNFGYDGSTTTDILEKVEEVSIINPDLTILMIGANDPVLDVDIETHIKNLKKIKKEFKNIFISTDNCPWNTVAQEKYLPYIEADVKENFENFINLFEMSKDFPSERIYTFKSEENLVEGIKEGDLDYWHPNQLGNAYIAKVILKEIFNIDFDPEIYWKDVQVGEKYPSY